MAQRQTTRFDKFEFEPGERFFLSDVQRQYIQTILTEEAEKRLALEVNTINIMEFVQAEAYLKGKIELAQQILDLSEDTLNSGTLSGD